MRGASIAVALVFALACGGVTKNDKNGSGGSGGVATGGKGGTGGAAAGGAKCVPGDKMCPDPSGKLVCVTGNSPDTGCSSPSCAPCALANATSLCSDTGACIVYACHAGFADCNGEPSDGCESNVSTDLHHCGNCGNDCTQVDGPWICQGGQCVLNSGACEVPGYSNCDGNDVNGCETNTNTDVSNCGACGKVCDATNGVSVCGNAVCSIVCLPGYGDCDGNVDTGCETNLGSDPANCSQCGLACPGTQCVNGACTST